MSKKSLWITGDIHGEIPTLVWSLKVKKIQNAAIIIAGDVGIGSEKDDYWRTRIYPRIKRYLESSGVHLYGVRGNHDNPDRFHGNFPDFPNFHLLEDYEPFEFEGLRVLPVGGAQSIDLEWREKVNKKYEAFGSHRRIWWPLERPTKDLSLLQEGHYDIVVSHEAPIGIGPVLQRTTESLEVYQGIREDREYLQELMTTVNPSWWFFGHYHKSFSGNSGDFMWRGLGCNELFKVI